ncbi:MAG TPA: hypothetical protein VFQ83_15655 [Candidatus Udaeobacter sp.]|nr:hypothetical protein [Candidatus Udaeobacter sp.]
MKTLLFLGATLIVLDIAIFPASAQTASASPTVPGGKSPVPSATATATATPNGSKSGEPAAKVTPAVTASPSGGAQLEGESSRSAQSPLPVATPPETSKPTPRWRPHRKLERREGSTPENRSGEHK